MEVVTGVVNVILNLRDYIYSMFLLRREDISPFTHLSTTTMFLVLELLQTASTCILASSLHRSSIEEDLPVPSPSKSPKVPTPEYAVLYCADGL